MFYACNFFFFFYFLFSRNFFAAYEFYDTESCKEWLTYVLLVFVVKRSLSK